MARIRHWIGLSCVTAVIFACGCASWRHQSVDDRSATQSSSLDDNPLMGGWVQDLVRISMEDWNFRK